jgi:hypothetical protein
MNRRNLLIIVFTIFAVAAQAQIFDPVTWDFSYEKKGDKLYDLVLTATIDEGSHIFPKADQFQQASISILSPDTHPTEKLLK